MSEQIIIPDSGKEATPLDELHFWQWLEQGNGTHYYTETLRQYLESLGQGFPERGVRHLSDDDSELLHAVYSHFKWLECRKEWVVGLVYHGSTEPLQTCTVTAPDKQTALNKAVNILKPNHLQTLTVELLLK